MQASRFNVRVPLPTPDQVFLMNTLTDAQVVVTADVAALIDRVESSENFTDEECDALALLEYNGFLVSDRATEQRALEEYFRAVKGSTAELNVTILTTL